MYSTTGGRGNLKCRHNPARSGLFNHTQRGATVDGSTLFGHQIADDAGTGSAQLVLHLHRFDHQQAIPLGDLLAFFDQDGDDLAGHRRGDIRRPRGPGDRFTLAVSLDGKTWKPLWKAQGRGDHAAEVVLDEALDVRNKPAKYGYAIRVGLESPGAALAEGIDWQWETFPEYLDALDTMPRTIDIAAQVPHGAVRSYVMGERCNTDELPSDADIDAMSLPALRAIRGKQVHQLVGIVFDEAVKFDDFKIEVNGQVVGDVRSQVWSPRYRKFLTMVMMKREFLSSNTTVTTGGKLGKIVDLPFHFDAIA